MLVMSWVFCEADVLFVMSRLARPCLEKHNILVQSTTVSL